MVWRFIGKLTIRGLDPVGDRVSSDRNSFTDTLNSRRQSFPAVYLCQYDRLNMTWSVNNAPKSTAKSIGTNPRRIIENPDRGDGVTNSASEFRKKGTYFFLKCSGFRRLPSQHAVAIHELGLII